MIGRLGMLDHDLELSPQFGNAEFIWLHFKPEMMRQLNIPSASYPMKKSSFDELIGRSGLVSASDLIRGLMSWLDVTEEPEPIWEILRKLMHLHFPPSMEKDAGCEFLTDDLSRHRFRIGPIGATVRAIGWYCGDWAAVIGCSSKVEPGRLHIAAPHPFSLRISQSIFEHSRIDCDIASDDNFRSALLQTRPASSFQEWETGKTMLVAWYQGYGATEETWKSNGPANVRMLPAVERWLAPNQVAAMVAVGNGYL